MKIRNIITVTMLAGLLAGCTLNEATGEQEFDAAKAEAITATAKEVVEKSPANGTPLGVAIGALMTLLGAGFGYVARKKKEDKQAK